MAGVNSTGLVIASGTIAFAGSMKESHGWPSNGVRVITGTTILAILTSITDDTAIAEPVKWLAILMLLSVLIRYVPKFSKKGK